MRQAFVYRKNVLVGLLTEDEGEYSFVYDNNYLKLKDSRAISPTVPMREQPYVSPKAPPFLCKKVFWNERYSSTGVYPGRP